MTISHHQVRETGEAVFETKSWCPPELSLQLLGEQLQQEVDTRYPHWQLYCSNHRWYIVQVKTPPPPHLLSQLLRPRRTRPPLVGKTTSPPLLRNWSKLPRGKDLRQHLINSSCLLVVEILLKSATPPQGVIENTFIWGKVIYQSLHPLLGQAKKTQDLVADLCST